MVATRPPAYTLRTSEAEALVGDEPTLPKGVRPLSEIIGQTTYDTTLYPSAINQIPVPGILSTDRTRPDYAFWSRLYHNQMPEYNYGAIFAKPLVEILSAWVIGRGFSVKSKNERVKEVLNDFAKRQRYTIRRAVRSAFSLGDGYLVLNSDTSLTPVQPDVMWIITEKYNPYVVETYVIKANFGDRIVEDHYYRNYRRVQSSIVSGPPRDGGALNIRAEEPILYANLTDDFRVVHFAHNQAENELYGRPMYDGLLEPFFKTNGLLTKSIDGVEVMGHPIPVMENLEDPELARRLNATRIEPYTDADGNQRQRYIFDFAERQLLFLPKGGTMKFASPAAMAAESLSLLDHLTERVFMHCNIPLWAAGLSSKKSTKEGLEAEKEAFFLYLDGLRSWLEPGIRQMLQGVLDIKSLSQPGLRRDGDFDIIWPRYTISLNESEQAWVKWAYSQRILTPERAHEISGVITDGEEELEAMNEQLGDDNLLYHGFASQFDDSLDTEVKRLKASTDTSRKDFRSGTTNGK